VAKRRKKRIKRQILFVGAGASRACGYPLTSEILPEIKRRLSTNTFDDEHIEKHEGGLRRLLRRLVPGSDKKQQPLITDVLSILDHCLESGEELFSASPKTLDLRDARWLLERAMARSIKYIHKREVVPREIVNWIRKSEAKGNEVTVISTNYDFSLDRALFDDLDDWSKDYLKMDFGFTWRDPENGALVHPAQKAKLRLYKLHGSLNWLGCHRCGNTYVNFARTLVTLADGNGKYSQCECGYKPLRAVLVAPSFVRRYQDRNLLSVWRSATEALRLADEWIFIGYSLPSEDVAIRALLLRSTFARGDKPVVRAVSASNDSLLRYRQMFPGCHYTGDGLRRFLDGTCSWSPT
jgi:NAD-dependent SIR2 family protein deacetylase